MIAAPPVPFTATPPVPLHAMIATPDADFPTTGTLLGEILVASQRYAAAQPGKQRLAITGQIERAIDLLEIEAVTRQERDDLERNLAHLRRVVDERRMADVGASVAFLAVVFAQGTQRGASAHEDG